MANPSLFYCLRFVFQNLFSRIFKVVTVQLSRFRPLCSRNSLIILAHRFVLVKYFFNFFKSSFVVNRFFSVSFQIVSHLSQFVKCFFQLFSPLKRRKRDLNPRAAINDLLPFQGSPFGQLGYFSKLPYLLISLISNVAVFV